METIRIPRVMQDTSRGLLRHGKTIGFVPTMGALHEGHLSLVRMSKQENDVTVVSIYVNPTQFGPLEDFKKYPRDVEGDTAKLAGQEVDILFIPDDSLMYPDGFTAQVEVPALSGKLCGAFRPGHFSGVATVVTKLFNLVLPVRAYFGQKDFQQTVIIKQLVKDLDMGITVVACPTIREADGLALSSRNQYLSPEEREAAGVIYQSLSRASDAIKSGIITVEYIKELMLDTLRMEPLVSEIQYCSVYDTVTLNEIETVKRDAVLAVALKIGSTRLIDNMVISTEDFRFSPIVV